MNRKRSRVLSAILKLLRSRPSFDAVGIEAYRTLLEKGAQAFKPDPSVKIEPFRIKTIEARWLLPDNHLEKRIILYVHGGGYIAGSMNSHRDLAARIGVAANARVLIFNYGLAPEHLFPKGLTDVKTVYSWLMESYGTTHSISLVGDSAGAGLSLALLSSLLMDKSPLPVCTALISPWIDLECKNKSCIENQDKDPMLSRDTLKRTARLYTDQDLSHPLISPINSNFSNICPVLIQTGENEILMDDATILAEKLKQANAIVQLEVWDDMFHVWHYFARYLKEGRQAIHHIGQFIKKYS